MSLAVPVSTGRHCPASARSFVYRFLSRVFWKSVTDNFLRGITEEVISLFAAYSPGIHFGQVIQHALVERSQLELEFTRLFIQPPVIVPLQESLLLANYSSVKQELFGREAQAIKRLLASLGLEPTEGFFGLFDHVALELELMGRLVAIDTPDSQPKSEELQRYLYRRHLSAWVPQFSCRLQHATKPGSFYHSMGNLTCSFIEREKVLYGDTPS